MARNFRATIVPLKVPAVRSGPGARQVRMSDGGDVDHDAGCRKPDSSRIWTNGSEGTHELKRYASPSARRTHADDESHLSLSDDNHLGWQPVDSRLKWR